MGSLAVNFTMDEAEQNRDSDVSFGHRQPAAANNGHRVSFRTSGDETIANEILARNKGIKIDSRSLLSRAFMTKSKRTTYNERDIFRALSAVVNGHEDAGPGVVEFLRDSFLAQGGDINFIPRKKTLGTVLRKTIDERSGLLEIATRACNVEVVQLLSGRSDKAGLDNAIEIAIQNRNTASRDGVAKRLDQIIELLISSGADGSSTIKAAVAIGDERLLLILLEGHPDDATLCEALPMAVAFPETEIRRRLIQMLLRKGASVNFNKGDSISQAVKLFDLGSLDMLLQRHPQASSLSEAFALALDQQDSDKRFELCKKLIVAGATGEEVDKGLNIAIMAEHQNIEFLKLILLSASVDYDNGHALCMAIANKQESYLTLMLQKRPNELTFDHAFGAAMRLRNPRDQFKYNHLLVGASPPLNSCSKALIYAVKSSKEELCKVFLEKGASPDFDKGASIAAAASSENIGILELLIGGHHQRLNNSSLVTGFEAIMSIPQPSPKKMKMLQIILAAGLSGPPLDLALVNASRQGYDGIPLCKLLLEYGASVNAHGGEALDLTCRCGNLELMNILLQGSDHPNAEVLSKIFQSALKLDTKIRHLATAMILKARLPIDDKVAAALDCLVQERQIDMQTIKVLLSFNTSVHYENHRPLVAAATSLNTPLLRLLLAYSSNVSAASHVFDAVMKLQTLWTKRECFEVLTILLENGALGITVNEALIRAVGDTNPNARHFEVTLLQHPVDINYKDGEALQIATERGEPELVRRMLAMKPSPDSLSMAFPFAFHSKLGEKSTLDVINSFIEVSGGELDPDFMHPIIPEPPILLCLNHFPNSLEILESTLKAGFHVDQVVSSENGSFTPLYWALSAQGNKVNDLVVERMIKQGAVLRNHPRPLLHLAVASSRHQIVQALIDAQADIDLADEGGFTPLNVATQINDVASIQALLKASAFPNDGSLHDAARMVNSDVINLLLQHGYDPNFPSIRSDGRPPLFELCLHAPFYLQQSQSTIQQKEKQIKEAIQALIQGGALTGEQLPQAENRSMIIHALDSSNPLMMTKALLECGLFKDINKDLNLFDDGKYTYSLTKYVEKGKCRGDKTQTQALIKLLKGFGAKDRFWKNEGPQPPDMVDPPSRIALAEEERKLALKRRQEEEDALRRRIEAQQLEIANQRRKIALEQEAEQAKQAREDLIFRQRQAQEQRIHEANIKKENDRLKLMQAKDTHALRQAASLSKLRNDENELEHKRRLKLIGEKKSLAQSEVALGWAYNQGLQDAGAPGANRRALGTSSSKTNLSFARRMQIEGPRIMEVDE